MIGRLEAARGGASPLILYPLLALLAFPILGAIAFGPHGVDYAHDHFDLPRIGVGTNWLAEGPSLWNPFLYAGNPLLVGHLSPFAIDVALAFVVDPFVAGVASQWLTASIAGIGMHLFLRDSMGMRTAAVIGGSILFTFAFWHPAYAFAIPLLPLGLWSLDRTLDPDRRRWRYLVGGAVVAALAFHLGLAQVVILVAAFQLVYVLVARSTPSVGTRLAAWAAIWAFGLAMYAPILATQLVALPASQRAIWDLAALSDTSLPTVIREWVGRYSSVGFGVPIGRFLGQGADVYGTFFVGALGLPAMALGLVGARHDRRTATIIGLVVAIPLIDLVAVMATPIYDRLGILGSFQFVRVRHLWPFALTVLTALGFDVALRALIEGHPILPSARWRRAVVALAFVPLAVSALVAGRAIAIRLGRIGDGDLRTLGWVLVALALVIGIVAVVAVTIAASRQRARRDPASTSTLPRVVRLVVLVTLVVLVAERMLYVHGERFLGTGLGTYAERLQPTPVQRFLGAQDGIELDRVLTFGDAANRMGAAGLRQVDGYDAMYPLTYHRFFGALIEPQLAVDPQAATYYRNWGNRASAFGPRVDPELVALAGVRWLYVRGDEAPTVPGLIERFRDGDVVAYEVPAVLPRAFIASAVDARTSSEAVVAAMTVATIDELRTTAYALEGPDADLLRSTGAPAADPASGSTPATGGGAAIVEHSADRVVVDVDADGPGVLILTDVMAPGWVAEVDGQPISIATVDATFRGVPVDAATRQVVFSYRPTFTYVGFAVAGLAIVGLVALGWWRRRRDAVAQPGLSDAASGAALPERPSSHDGSAPAA